MSKLSNKYYKIKIWFFRLNPVCQTGVVTLMFTASVSLMFSFFYFVTFSLEVLSFALLSWLGLVVGLTFTNMLAKFLAASKYPKLVFLTPLVTYYITSWLLFLAINFFVEITNNIQSIIPYQYVNKDKFIFLIFLSFFYAICVLAVNIIANITCVVVFYKKRKKINAECG